MGNKDADGRLRIAMLGHKFIPSRDGGIEVVVGELTTRMAALGHSVTCYNRTNAANRQALKENRLPTEYSGVRMIWVPTIDRRGLAALSASIVATIRAAFGKYDVVHFHAEGPCVICWLPRLLGKKVIVTIHGLDHKRQKWGRVASACIKKKKKNAALLSKGVQQYFREQYGRETVIVPNGISPSAPLRANLISKKFGLEPRKYILFLGRLVPEKGIHYLIQAYQGLKTDCKLVIAGGVSDTGNYVRSLREMAKENPNIIFTDFVEGQILEELYSNAYIYALPSDLEGMPISLLEAMSYGCCCVTSDISECTDVTGEFGASFLRGNADALRETLQELCDHPEEAERLGAGAKADVTRRFSWDETVEETLRLYRKALNQ